MVCVNYVLQQNVERGNVEELVMLNVESFTAMLQQNKQPQTRLLDYIEDLDWNCLGLFQPKCSLCL